MQTWSLCDGTWKQGEDPTATAWWFDVVTPEGGLSDLAERFSLHPLAVEDCYSSLIHVPKIDDFGTHVFVVIQVLCVDAADAAFEELDVFLGPNFVITYADRPLPDLDVNHRALAKGIAPRPGPDGIFHAIFDVAVDSMLPTVTSLADRLDSLQEEVVQQPGAASHTAILAIRAQAGRLRRILTPEMSVAMLLSRGEYSVVQDANRIYFRDIYDHLARVDLSLEGVREDAEVALSTYLSAINNRMNEVMKVLSVVSALALPAVVITGVFGTNFDNVPGLHSNWGFTFMLAAMAGAAGGMAYYFRRRRWF